MGDFAIIEAAHDKIYKKAYATSEDSDQTACLLQPPDYPKRDTRKPLQYWVDEQTDLSLVWLHRSYCRFCHAIAHMCLRTELKLWQPYES